MVVVGEAPWHHVCEISLFLGYFIQLVREREGERAKDRGTVVPELPLLSWFLSIWC